MSKFQNSIFLGYRIQWPAGEQGRVLLKVVNIVVDVDVNVDFTSEFTCAYRTFY